MSRVLRVSQSALLLGVVLCLSGFDSFQELQLEEESSNSSYTAFYSSSNDQDSSSSEDQDFSSSNDQESFCSIYQDNVSLNYLNNSSSIDHDYRSSDDEESSSSSEGPSSSSDGKNLESCEELPLDQIAELISKFSDPRFQVRQAAWNDLIALLNSFVTSNSSARDCACAKIIELRDMIDTLPDKESRLRLGTAIDSVENKSCIPDCITAGKGKWCGCYLKTPGEGWIFFPGMADDGDPIVDYGKSQCVMYMTKYACENDHFGREFKHCYLEW